MNAVTMGRGAALAAIFLWGAAQAAGNVAQCAAISADTYVTRNELASGQRRADAQLLLRFVQLTDDHITDDDGEAINGASAIDPVVPTFEAAMRLQQEYSDEVLNDMVGRLNQCQASYPFEFAIVTGDSADMTTVAETRRFIDNLDGRYDQPSAFETKCRARLPAMASAATIDALCTRFTGRGVADTQAVDPNPDRLVQKSLWTRTVAQLLATEAAATSGRAADGSLSLKRQTATRSPGMPQVLRCNAGTPGCANQQLNMPWYIAFGNHDGYLRGTIALTLGLNQVSLVTGRHYMFDQHEFIDEFFYSQPTPGPLGHGFNYADSVRRIDGDSRNDGYYATDAGSGRVRLIVLNTIVDGVDPRIPLDLLRNPFALSDGSLDRVQFEWLKNELASSAARGQLAIVFSHHPDLTFAEYGMFAKLVPIEVTAAELDAELASWPHLIAWVAGHTHQHRIRAFKVAGGRGSNGTVDTPVSCKQPGRCQGFWQIETASLIDHPQEQRLLEVLDNGDGSGTLRGSVLQHGYAKAKALAAADDRCALYLSDPKAVLSGISEAGLNLLCAQGGVRQGTAADRNVDLMFRMP
ncbi:Calcineurin-like phosphoesterase [Solimonas aquatica]|uniref:Calcineurin-like phosphoesterase n=1 Tax=Solimonas aquatica TaxID=489703 RepID=A0A1H9CQ51_9GAMM|nr:metallophosphoesterase [Solimonas aquatica]SEQ03356.1 Calcineurin-like phosphoesterase [Solimonas aquatica]